MSTPGSRLRQARKNAGFKGAKSAADHFGWPESSYRAHEKAGEDTPSARNYGLDDAEKYGEAFGVNPRWLWNGEDEGPSTRAAQALPNAAMRTSAPFISAKRIPIYGHAVAGKDGRFAMNGDPIDHIVCPPGLENTPGAYAVYAVGDSMEPRYFAGEVVFVHPNKPVRRGNFVVVQIVNEADPDGAPLGYIKQYITETPSKLVLCQYNPKKELEFDRKTVVSVHRIVFSGES